MPDPAPDGTGRVAIIAHRGCSAAAPENTMAAFERALALPVDAIETDVRLAADGTAVLIHDEDLRRTGGQDRRVVDLTAAELGRVDVGSWMDEVYGGETVPRLAELAARCREAGAGLVLDLKVDGAAAAIAAALNEAGLPRDRASVCAWTAAQAEDALAHLRGSPLLFIEERLQRRDPPFWQELARRGFAGASLDLADVTPEVVHAARAAGLSLLTWTVNRPEDQRAMLRIGVDGIITDEPANLRAARDAWPVS